VKFVMEGGVEPGDPDHGEHRGELAESGPGQVDGQLMGRAGHEYDYDQIEEQLQRADRPRPGLLAVRARWLPQQSPQPGPGLLV
jgi:hypothetical protein